jgi:hypothetical protein
MTDPLTQPRDPKCPPYWLRDEPDREVEQRQLEQMQRLEEAHQKAKVSPAPLPARE